MMLTLKLKIADYIIEFFCHNRKFLQRLSDIYMPFTTGEKSHFFLELKTSRFNNSKNKESVENSANEKEILLLKGLAFSGLLNLRKKSGILNLLPDQKIFDRAFRVVLSQLLPLENGLLIHGATICNQNRGFLFYGKSNAGKTTISEASRRAGKKVLTDELAVVRKIKNRYWVFGTPFWGEMGGAFHGRKIPIVRWISAR